jgi:hypothetical protein
MRCHDAANRTYEGGSAMTDYPTERAARHRVDPMRPANHPITDDAELEDLYQDFYQERVRKGRVSWRLILLLVIGFIVAVLLVMAGIG